MIYIILKMNNLSTNNNNLLGINTNNIEGFNITEYYPDENDKIKSLEKAGMIHKEVRRQLYDILKPGMKLIDIAKFIEMKTEELNNKNNINKGIGFPVSLGVNNCAAHWHPEANDTTTLKKGDIIKIDFGIEVNSWIIDCAFTAYFDHKHDNLANAVAEATNIGIKNAGIDVDINDWAKDIQEVMLSYNINPITNLGGHNIEKGIIHGGMFLPAVPNKNLIYKRFTEGVYAIETFGSTQDDSTYELGESTLFRINPFINPEFKLETTKKFYNKLKSNFKTLPFTNRYVDTLNSYKTQLQILTKNNSIHSYPPLYVNNGFVAQYEHTIYINENNKIIFSQNNDY